MNLLERLLAVFSGEKPDVMPWFADLTYWYRARLYHSDLPTKYLGEKGRIRLYRDLGCGAHEELYNLPGTVAYYGVKHVRSVETLRDGTTISEETYKTPVGSIKSVTKFVPKSVSSAHIKYAVENRRDLRVLQYIYKLSLIHI